VGADEKGPSLTHVNAAGAARMVDVTAKSVTEREAEARGAVLMKPETLALVRTNAIAKGDVLAVARIAGIMAAKRTPELIPLCHGLPLSSAEVEFELRENPPSIEIQARVRTEARTGVEMEALAAVSIAALTIYDMCKAVDRGMEIGRIRVTYKAGGRSGVFRAG